jgi:hypothetical protein
LAVYLIEDTATPKTVSPWHPYLTLPSDDADAATIRSTAGA